MACVGEIFGLRTAYGRQETVVRGIWMAFSQGGGGKQRILVLAVRKLARFDVCLNKSHKHKWIQSLPTWNTKAYWRYCVNCFHCTEWTYKYRQLNSSKRPATIQLIEARFWNKHHQFWSAQTDAYPEGCLSNFFKRLQRNGIIEVQHVHCWSLVWQAIQWSNRESH